MPVGNAMDQEGQANPHAGLPEFLTSGVILVPMPHDDADDENQKRDEGKLHSASYPDRATWDRRDRQTNLDRGPAGTP